MSIRDGICPECGSREVYKRNGWFNNIIVAWMPPRLEVYACTDCGHLAEFIVGRQHLQHIQNNWKKVEPTMKRKNDEIQAKQTLTES